MPENNVSPYLARLMASYKEESAAQGICLINSSHPLVLRALMRQSRGANVPLFLALNENSQSPAVYADYVKKLAQAEGFPVEQLFLADGWRDSPVVQARQRVIDCVRAGFNLIFLNCWDKDFLGCAEDMTEVAARHVDLCQAAEQAAQSEGSLDSKPWYVLGMPTWDWNSEKLAAYQYAIESAFKQAGLTNAWQRVVSLNIPMDMGFTDNFACDYQPELGADLKAFYEKEGHLVYYMPHADYQSTQALRDMLADHFALLEIGPMLSFAMREALFALAMIENEWMIGKPGAHLSNLIVELDKAMQLNPAHWQAHYTTGNGFDQMLARKYSYQDRSRFYWQEKDVQSAIDQLFKNLSETPPPLTLLRQFMPDLYWPLREGTLENKPEALVIRRIQQAYQPYLVACNQLGEK